MLWDSIQPHVFIAYDEKSCNTFVYVKHSTEGRHVVLVDGITALMSGQTPIMMYDGDLTVSSTGGKLSMLTLATHLNSPGDEPTEQLLTFIQLRKYADAWEICKLLNDREEWNRLGRAAISDLNVAFGKTDDKSLQGFQ